MFFTLLELDNEGTNKNFKLKGEKSSFIKVWEGNGHSTLFHGSFNHTQFFFFFTMIKW